MKNTKIKKQLLNIFYLGSPGSGKGTQAKLMAQYFHLRKINAGGILRQLAKEKSYFGQKIDKILKTGQMVPTWLVTVLWFNFLRRTRSSEGIIAEGNPRNLLEAKILDEMLKLLGRKNLKVIYLKVSLKEAEQRLLNRRICQKCGEPISLSLEPGLKKCPKCGGLLIRRPDDQPKAIKQRFQIFRKQIIPIIRYYRKKKILIEVNGEGAINKIFKETLTKLKYK